MNTLSPPSPPSSPLRWVLAATAAVALTFAGAFAVDLTVRSSPSEPTAAAADAPAAPGASAAGSGSTDAGPPAAYAIASFRFDPSPLTIRAGQTVTVTNQDQAKHTATSGTRDHPDGKFDLKLEGGAKGTLPSLSPGTYTVYCAIHPGMKGSIEVTP
jgi:plastocyanin